MSDAQNYIIVPKFYQNFSPYSFSPPTTPLTSWHVMRWRTEREKLANGRTEVETIEGDGNAEDARLQMTQEPASVVQ